MNRDELIESAHYFESEPVAEEDGYWVRLEDALGLIDPARPSDEVTGLRAAAEKAASILEARGGYGYTDALAVLRAALANTKDEPNQWG